jgi:hypothetical protein
MSSCSKKKIKKSNTPFPGPYNLRKEKNHTSTIQPQPFAQSHPLALMAEQKPRIDHKLAQKLVLAVNVEEGW